MRAVLPAAWLGVRHGWLPLPVLAAVALVLSTLPWQDEGKAVPVLHGVAVLLACAMASCLDDPSHDLAAAAPVPLRTRTAGRVLVAGAFVLPVLVAAFAVARWRFAPLPVAGLAAEAAGYLVAGVTVAAALRAWRGTAVPSYPAVTGVLVVALLTWSLPRGWAMVDPQPWGPPYDAALWRWVGLLLVASASLLAATRDPLDRGRPARMGARIEPNGPRSRTLGGLSPAR